MIAHPKGITVIGGGAVDDADLTQALAVAPLLVAADGGADSALRLGRIPDHVIGDLDSLGDHARARIAPDRIHHIAEQDSTDFTKCLRRSHAPLIMAVGFAGLRLDHNLAALTAMVAPGAPRVVMLAPEDVVLAAPARLRLDIAAGTRVSLFPMGPARGRGTGLEWPIDGLEFAPALRVGTSNRATGPVTLEIEGPMLVMLPRDCLGQVLAAL
ncbi:thiamine diphosphokinase [Paracoccus sp. 1_MG-2023]|uniref:thiamine diphosphokinase n=1 Tax=unclassified Paracoccus (in: a-proteobacteria) TaxID=2688777 RepID=UPI001C089911|nr:MULTISPECIES: thiamine diphosphokinase [unclassified Paracoccus (in: a-proteobacteria)]MBU2958681.1 thiamine diphosphokinase [Paracoccus sp. C2R09]MDO6667674.1 thiamine diphosphokinase [Paracoccus sp. 1_MG-2023]